MSVFERPSFDGHESVHFFHDEDTGLKAIVAIHSTARGPGAGGVRMWTYPSSEEALRDVLRLSRGMSYKNAMADLPLGGGKAVIMKPEGEFDRTALFEAYGRCVDSLGGRYITAEDVGVGPEDMIAVRRSTRFVAGLTEGAAASGDPSPVTARGVFNGVKTCVRRGLDRDDLAGVRVAVQGVGHVGGYLCDFLADAGAELVITDVDKDLLGRVAERTGAAVVEPDAIYDADVDVFAPCALGAIINPKTIDRLKCKIVAGGANNQLETPAMGVELAERGILYAPDYVINGGGIINVAGEISGDYDPEWVNDKLKQLDATLDEVLQRAADSGRPPHEIADEVARERIASAKREMTPA
jgi:leucine dehydrogenase